MNLIVMEILCLSFAKNEDEGNSVMKWRIIATGKTVLLYYCTIAYNMIGPIPPPSSTSQACSSSPCFTLMCLLYLLIMLNVQVTYVIHKSRNLIYP